MTPTRLAVIVGCTYEIVALVTNRVPTITVLVKRLGRHPVGRFGMWCWCGYVAHHFLEPETS